MVGLVHVRCRYWLLCLLSSSYVFFHFTNPGYGLIVRIGGASFLCNTATASKHFCTSRHGVLVPIVRLAVQLRAMYSV